MSTPTPPAASPESYPQQQSTPPEYPQQQGYPQQGYPQQGYQQPYPGGQYAPARTNTLAIVTLVLALVSISIGAVITGHISLKQIRKTGEQGHGLALAGLIIGYIGCAGWVIVWIVWIFALLIPLAMYGSVTTNIPSSLGA